MKQIYNFEQNTPPVLNETILRAELERSKLQKETALLVISSLLILFSMYLMAIQLYDILPFLSITCMVYILAAITGGSVIALLFAHKRRLFIKC